MSGALSSLAALLYYNGFRSEYAALPVCATNTTAGLTYNGIPIAIYATGVYSTNLYFVFGATGFSNSSANVVFSTTGVSSYVILYDNVQIKQGS